MAEEKVKLGGGSGGDNETPKITVHVGKQGAPIKDRQYGAGTKQKQIVKDFELEGKEIRVDGNPYEPEKELEDNQTIVAVPPAVSGGRA